MKNRRQGAINAAAKVIATRTYGDVLYYDYLETLLGEEIGTYDFAISFALFKTELIKHGYVLSCLINEGYRILLPNEIAKEVMDKYVKKSVKSIERGIAIMQYTNTDTLTMPEANEFQAVSDMLQTVYKFNTEEIYNTQIAINETKRLELGE